MDLTSEKQQAALDDLLREHVVHVGDRDAAGPARLACPTDGGWDDTVFPCRSLVALADLLGRDVDELARYASTIVD